MIKFIKMQKINSILNEYACPLNLSLNLCTLSILQFIIIMGSHKFIIWKFSAIREHYKFQDQMALVFLHLEWNLHIHCWTYVATRFGSTKFSIYLFLLFIKDYGTITECTTGSISWSTSLLRQSSHTTCQGCLQSSMIILCTNLGGSECCAFLIRLVSTLGHATTGAPCTALTGANICYAKACFPASSEYLMNLWKQSFISIVGSKSCLCT
jgi:hypothetical protein